MDNFLKNLLGETHPNETPKPSPEMEEQTILENVSEGIVTMNYDFLIVKINKVAEKITGVTNQNAAGADFFTHFRLFDHDKNIIDKTKFPQKDFASTFTGFAEENVFIERADKSQVEINFKFSVARDQEGKIMSFLFVFSEVYEGKAQTPSNVMLESLDKFETILIQNLDNSPKRMIYFYQNLEILYRLSVGEIPGLLSDIDVGESVQKVVGRKVGLSYEYNVNLTYQTLHSLPLPIKTSRFVFEKAIEKIVELGVFIAARSATKQVIVSAEQSNENIFVYTRTTVYDGFPWDQAAELIKPFFGTLVHEEKLLHASGLEGYLAENLLKAKGFEGGITGEKYDDGVNNPQLVLTIILPYSTA